MHLQQFVQTCLHWFYTNPSEVGGKASMCEYYVQTAAQI